MHAVSANLIEPSSCLPQRATSTLFHAYVYFRLRDGEIDTAAHDREHHIAMDVE